jgi:hypothetical protein
MKHFSKLHIGNPKMIVFIYAQCAMLSQIISLEATGDAHSSSVGGKRGVWSRAPELVPVLSSTSSTSSRASSNWFAKRFFRRSSRSLMWATLPA